MASLPAGPNKRRTHCAMAHRFNINIGRVVDEVAKAGLASSSPCRVRPP